MSIIQVFFLVILVWFLICVTYIGRNAFQSAKENQLNPVLWMFLTIMLCISSFVGISFIVSIFTAILTDILGLSRSFFGLVLTRFVPLMSGLFVGYKLTFYVIDNMSEVSAKLFNTKTAN
jgi:hypothetical protein